jgi:hypothetical protein
MQDSPGLTPPSGRARSSPALMGAIVACAAVIGCSSDGAAPPATTIDGGATTASDASSTTFRVQALEGCGAAGTQAVAAVSGSTVAFASLAATTGEAPCTTMNGVSQVQVWDVCYAVSQGQGAYKTSVVTSQPYLTPTGVGLAFDPAGEATIAFTGGGPAKLRCGASELYFVTTKGGATGGTFGTPTKVASGSASAALVPDQAANCVQNICNSGDATGFWPSLAFDPAGHATVVFRDLHFGFASDDFASSDVEFAPGPGFSMLTVDVARGGGTYLRLAFTPDGKAAVAHYSADRSPSIWLDRQTDAGWASQTVATGPIGEQLGFAVNAKGLFALAYYDQTGARLRYTESPDGATWSAPSNVDLDGSTGFYPSLAFDAAGDPAIAYYRCNAKGPSESSCDAAHDGLYLARRKGGSWRVQVVRADTSNFEGLYPALAFVGGRATIAYQARSFDAASQKSTVSWWVAEEP